MLNIAGLVHRRAVFVVIAALSVLPALRTAAPAMIEKVRYTLTVENRTELSLQVIMHHPVTLGVISFDVSPNSKKEMTGLLAPGKYKVDIVSDKCTFLKSTVETWVLANQSAKSIVVTDRNLSSKPLPAHCKDKTVTSDYGGKWVCTGRGWLDLTQESTPDGVVVTGLFGGKENEAWGKNNVSGGSVRGKVSGDEMDITFFNNDGTYTTTQVYQGRDKSSFSGKWKWYNGDGSYKGSGSWGCNRKR